MSEAYVVTLRASLMRLSVRRSGVENRPAV